MSYIRCLSNPEALYIIGTQEGQIQFFHDCTPANLSMPVRTFHGLLNKWQKEGEIDVKYRGASITENQSNFKFMLNYKGWKNPIEMWKVTLWYIYSRNNFKWQQKELDKKKNRKK